MKLITGFILFIIFILPTAMAQPEIEFDILFGSYINDSYKKEFHSNERKWTLQNKKLIYLIDAHDKKYADTITLKHIDIRTIESFIKETGLNQSISKKLDKNYLNKTEWTVIIKGNIKLNQECFNFNLSANSPAILDNDLDAKKIKKLEDLLYELVENH